MKLCYGSCVALWLDMFTLECYLDPELEQTGTVCVKEGDVGRESSVCRRYFRVGDRMMKGQVPG